VTTHQGVSVSVSEAATGKSRGGSAVTATEGSSGADVSRYLSSCGGARANRLGKVRL
jgi:hypothetical protein